MYEINTFYVINLEIILKFSLLLASFCIVLFM
jgi:hypothetical protein